MERETNIEGQEFVNPESSVEGAENILQEEEAQIRTYFRAGAGIGVGSVIAYAALELMGKTGVLGVDVSNSGDMTTIQIEVSNAGQILKFQLLASGAMLLSGAALAIRNKLNKYKK